VYKVGRAAPVAMLAAVTLLDPAVRFKGMVGSARGADHVVWPLRVMPFP